MHSNIFDRLSFFSLLLVITLLPVFFLPFTKIPVEISKGLLLVFGLAASFIFWVIARFFDGKLVLPKSWLLVSGFGVVVAFLISAISSGSSFANSQVSLFGTMLDVGSFWFIFSAFLLMFMSAIVVQTPKRAKVVLFGIIVSSAIVLIFQSLHLFMPVKLSLGILGSKIDNIVGSWNAFGIFAGFSCLIFLLVIEFFSISKVKKILLGTLILLSLLSIAAVNFPLVWILVGISSLIVFVYKVSAAQEQNDGVEKKKIFPVVSFFVVMISLLFFLNPLVYVPGKTGDFKYLSSVIPGYLGLQNGEVRPSLRSTMSVTLGVLKKDPVLGIGPNRFMEAWVMYKPSSINLTQFWDVSFVSGSGLLTTLAATTGALGVLSLLTFAVLFIVIGVRSIFSGLRNNVNWEIMAFFILSLYLFIASLFYSTGPVIFLLALALAGIFAGLSTRNSKNQEISFSFLNDPRKSFFSMLIIIAIIISTLTLVFKYIERFASDSYFRKTLASLADGNIELAESSISKSLSLNVNDLYLRVYGQIYFTKFSSLMAKGGSLSEEEKSLLQVSLDEAVKGVQGAINYNPKNYLNFQAFGSLFQNLTPFEIKDANANVRAIEAYSAASLLNPSSPRLKLSLAVVSFADKNPELAKEYTNAALALKPNYIDALIFLSQIAKSEGDNKLAISYAEQALALLPQNADLKKYVDALRNGNSAPTPLPASIDPSSVSENTSN